MLGVRIVGHIGGVVAVEIEFGLLGGDAVAFLEGRRGKAVRHALAVVGAEGQAPSVGERQFELVVALFDDGLAPEGRGDGAANLFGPGRLDPGVVADDIAGGCQGDGRRGQDLLPALADAPGDLFLDIDLDGCPAVGRRKFIDFGLGAASGQCACKGGQQEKSKKAFHIPGFKPYKITKKLLTL